MSDEMLVKSDDFSELEAEAAAEAAYEETQIPAGEPAAAEETFREEEQPAAPRDVMISFDKVVKLYPNGVHALRGLTFRIERGEFVFVMGASGAGKSTMLKILMREVDPSSGLAMVDGRNLKKIKGSRIPFYRRNIGMVFQDFRLLPKKTVFENVAFAMEITGASRKDIKHQVNTALSLVGLQHKANELPEHLSGGEQQRVAVARALVNAPQIIIADEPTGNLDPENSTEIMHLLEEINKHGITVLVATHERRLAESMDKRVIYLENGRLRDYDEVREEESFNE